MSTYRREHYLAKLRPFYNDSGLIKVITGIRRCGKSSLLITVLNELFEQGIPETNLIYLNLDRREYRNVTTPDQLDQLIEQAMSNAYGAGLRYLFIDEVQNVKGFETVINGWREEGNCSIFITGSNSYLLSGELATKLTGRYIKLEMFTLSFQEYLGMRNFLNKPEIPVSQAFRDYLTYGGFPKSLEYDDPDAKAAYIQDVIGQIFNKDITAHTSKEDMAISQFQSMCTALAGTIGTGNIVGVATAIVSGGPGSIFWMWVMALLGMMTSFSENVLGVYYRRKNEKGEWSGGAMYYLTDGLGAKKGCKQLGKVLAVLFACFCILASFGIGNMSQINSIAGNMNAAFHTPYLVTGVALMVVTALIVLGGLKRVAAVTEKLVPLMLSLIHI